MGRAKQTRGGRREPRGYLPSLSVLARSPAMSAAPHGHVASPMAPGDASPAWVCCKTPGPRRPPRAFIAVSEQVTTQAIFQLNK